MLLLSGFKYFCSAVIELVWDMSFVSPSIAHPPYVVLEAVKVAEIIVQGNDVG